MRSVYRYAKVWGNFIGYHYRTAHTKFFIIGLYQVEVIS